MKREEQLLIRVTKDEKQAFDESAQAAGISLSAWSRQQLRIAAIQELSRIGRKASFLKPVPITVDGN